jgi:DNA end-binding protein Ku
MQMQSIWKGAISFGLVNVPVKMYSATEDNDITMSYIHKLCATRVTNVRTCPACNIAVEYNDLVRAVEYQKNKFVNFEKDEIEQLTGESNNEIKILDFVGLEEIDPIYFQKTYYLSPGDTGLNAYALLMEALKQTGKIGIAQVSIRSKSSLCCIRVIDRCLVMETMFYPDEVRSIAQVPNLPITNDVNIDALEMSNVLIDRLSSPFAPEKYKDEYRAALVEAIQHKIAGEEVQSSPLIQKTNILDLMAELRASLEVVKDKPNLKNEVKTKASPKSKRKEKVSK